jgi:hypothetical protein
VSNSLGNAPVGAGFDSERIMVTNQLLNRVSLWKAADLTPLGFLHTGDDTNPTEVCSDGLNFRITLEAKAKLARF